MPPGSGESPFCPHCGAPQLYLSLDYQSAETGGEAKEEAAGAESTGLHPPPRPQQVDWRMAIRCAVAVAGVGAVLCVVSIRVALLSPLSSLWVMSASLIALSFYQRRRPGARMDASVGARIGAVVGLCLALGLGISMAGAGLVARFALHAMGSFDAEMAARTAEAIRNSSSPIPANMMGFLKSPEFRAGMMRGGFAVLSAFLMVLSTSVGAGAGRRGRQRKTML